MTQEPFFLAACTFPLMPVSGRLYLHGVYLRDTVDFIDIFFILYKLLGMINIVNLNECSIFLTFKLTCFLMHFHIL